VTSRGVTERLDWGEQKIHSGTRLALIYKCYDLYSVNIFRVQPGAAEGATLVELIEATSYYFCFLFISSIHLFIYLFYFHLSIFPIFPIFNLF
jgi:hypothetical protein